MPYLFKSALQITIDLCNLYQCKFRVGCNYQQMTIHTYWQLKRNDRSISFVLMYAFYGYFTRAVLAETPKGYCLSRAVTEVRSLNLAFSG